MINGRFGKLALTAAVLLIPGALSAGVPFTPAKGGYTIVFPDKPQEKEIALSPDVKSTIYSINRDDAAFLAGYTEYAQDVNVDKELAADIQSFVTSISAQMTDRKRSSVRLGDGTAIEKVEFAFDGEKSSGRGIAIMANRHSSVMIAGLYNKPSGKPADVDEFVKSFKLAAEQ